MKRTLGFMMLAATLTVLGCGGGQSEQTNTAPAAPQASTEAVDQEVVLQPLGNELKYDKTEFTVKTGTKVRLIMRNSATGPAAVMSHNVVVLRPEEGQDHKALIMEVGVQALQAMATEYVPDHPAVFAYTSLVPPGEEREVVFTAPAPGDYPYVCTFTGHYVTMNGTMRVVE